MRWMLLVPCGDVPWHSKCTANSANISPALTPLVALVYLAVVLVMCTFTCQQALNMCTFCQKHVTNVYLCSATYLGNMCTLLACGLEVKERLDFYDKKPSV